MPPANTPPPCNSSPNKFRLNPPEEATHPCVATTTATQATLPTKPTTTTLSSGYAGMRSLLKPPLSENSERSEISEFSEEATHSCVAATTAIKPTAHKAPLPPSSIPATQECVAYYHRHKAIEAALNL